VGLLLVGLRFHSGIFVLVVVLVGLFVVIVVVFLFGLFQEPLLGVVCGFVLFGLGLGIQVLSSV